MASSIKNVSACALLALTAFAAVVIIYCGGREGAPENLAGAQQTPTVTAEDPIAAQNLSPAQDPLVAMEPSFVMESSVAEEDVPLPPETIQVAQDGPLLLPLNPPYLASHTDDTEAGRVIEPADQQTSPGEPQLGETIWDQGEDEQPAENETARYGLPAEDDPFDDDPAAEEPAGDEVSVETQPAEDELPAESETVANQPAEPWQSPEEELPEEEPAGEKFPADEFAALGQPAGEEPALEEPAGEQPTEGEQPSETPRETTQKEATEATLPETSTLPEPKPEPKRELTAAEAALRDRLRRTVAFHYVQCLSASQNTATELMHGCLAFGCNAEIYRRGASGQKVNAVTCLCWNYPCAGYELLRLSENHITPRVGYGLQEHPSQLLAVLALSRVPVTYPVRVGEDVRTVADLVEHEKLSCRTGTDMSLKLIALAYYLEDEPAWTNDLGQEWSIERILEEELDQPILDAACGGTHRLAGISQALARQKNRRQPIEGQFARAQTFIEQYHQYALKLQNSDGSWGPRFLAAKGASRNPAAVLRSTGHVLEWLAMSLPEDRLDDPRVVRSVEYVNRLLSSQRYYRNVRALSTREIGSVMHALHALVVYDERFFQPRAPEPATDAEQVARKPASS